MWMTSCTGSVRGGFGGGEFEKSQLVEFCRQEKKVDFRSLTEALWRVPHMVWGRRKSQHSKMVSLSLCRTTFKLKDNKKKGFVPEQRSRVCRVSGFLCPMLRSNVRSIYVSHIRIMGMLHVDVVEFGADSYTNQNNYITRCHRRLHWVSSSPSYLYIVYFQHEYHTDVVS